MQLNDVSFAPLSNEELDLDAFVSALKNDLNTANAMTELYRIIKEGNVALRSREIDNNNVRRLFFTLEKMFYLLGFKFDYTILTSEDKTLFNEYMILTALTDILGT